MKEEDIRKRRLFDAYLALVAQDVKKLFSPKEYRAVACPACGSDEHSPEFTKTGFTYVTCASCSTLFVNPRPTYDMLRKFYSRSLSTSFFANEFMKPVIEARREKIFMPRAAFASTICERKKGNVIGDVGAGHGLFLEELRRITPDNEFVAIEPSEEMAEMCREKKFRVEQACAEEITGREGSFDLLTSFELIEHLFDPVSFLRRLRGLLKSGGRVLLTTLNGLGFDIALLWDRSKSVTPPHHLNFFNPVSMRRLCHFAGFEVEEVSTPGRLDWDIVEGMILKDGLSIDRLWNAFARHGSQGAKQQLQDWITRNNLSSHMRVIARKRT